MVQLRSLQTRQALIVATAEVVNERGYEKATLAQITARSQMSGGAFYFHFDSKEEAAHAVIEAQSTYSHRKALTIVDQGYSAFETMLRVSADFTYDILLDPLVRAGARLTYDVLVFDKNAIPAFEEWEKFNIMLLAKAVGEGDMRADINVEKIAGFIVGSYAGCYSTAILRNNLSSLSQQIMSLWEIIIRAEITADHDEWISLANQLFLGRPSPQSLTFQETTKRHLGQ